MASLSVAATSALSELRARRTIFSIIALPRSGSTLLCGLLDSHPDILCHYELFHPNEIALSLRIADRVHDTSARAPGVLPFLSALLGSHAEQFPAIRALGFKVLLSPPQMATALEDVATCRDIVKLVVDRRNRLAAYASVWTAMKTGLWQTETACAPARRVLHFDEDHFQAYVTETDRAMALVDRLLEGQPRLDLDYQDVVSPNVGPRVLEFLNVDPAPSLQSAWVKTGSACPLDAFDNPDAVRRCLSRLGKDEWIG
ncbi:MAG: sulfotransferase [Vicinamibacterales bacterium]